MKFQPYFDAFTEYLKECHCADRTIETYGYNLEKFLRFLETHYPRINSMEKVTKDIVHDYQQYLSTYRNRAGNPLSNKTQILKLIIVRSFFSYLVRQDLLLQNPASHLRLPKEERRITRNILTEKEVLTLLDKLNGHDPLSIRNRAIVELFYGCGLRTMELCRIKIRDLDLKEQTVTIVKGKGGKTRIVPIGQYAAYYLQRYLEKSRKFMLKGKQTDPGIVFLTRRGNAFNNTTINSSVMRSIEKKLSIKKHLSCYSIRHSVASHLLAHHVDITYIAKLLGHASLRTTQKYIHVEISDLKKMHSLYHPRERVIRKSR
jgi:site-specific recombinase XerD